MLQARRLLRKTAMERLPRWAEMCARILQQCEYLRGGRQNLAAFLNVEPPELEEWLSARSGPPRAVFEKAMEIILAEHDRRNQLDASAPAHLAGGFDLGEVPDAGDDLDAHAGHAAPQQLEPWRGLAGLQHRSEEHTSELQSPCNLVCRLLLEKKKKKDYEHRA